MISICSDSEEVQKSVSPTPEVDEEGYSKPPPNASRIGIDDDPLADFNRHQSNFGSSSDDSGKSSFKYIIRDRQFNCYKLNTLPAFLHYTCIPTFR